MKLLSRQHNTFIICLFLLVSCAACKPVHDSEERTVFRYNEHANIASLDPAFARNNAVIWATNQLFNGLVQFDDSLQVRPDIARRWEILDSARVYRFRLRDDVYFHKHALFGPDSTRQVVASDFVYSFDRLRNPRLASPGSWVLQPVESYRAVGDSVLEIHLKEPFPAFLGMLAMRYCSVVPQEVVSHYGADFRSHPIGTGPFYFKMWEENIKLVFRKNENYFETDAQGNRLPYLDAVAISFLPDKQSEFLQFVQGKLDFISGLDASYKDELLTPQGQLSEKYRSRVQLLKSPYLNTEFIALQTQFADNPALRSPLVRRAINYGFDRRKMLVYLRNDVGIPAEQGMIPKGLPGHGAPGYDYQPEQARELVRLYKEQSGQATVQITLTTDSNYVDLYEYLQRELEKIGLSVSVEMVPAASIRQARANGSLEAFRSSWVADYPDAQNYLSLFYSPNHTPAGANYTYYSDSLFDARYRAAMLTPSDSLRTHLYREMDSLVMEAAPVVPMYYDEAVRFVGKNISGLGVNPQNNLVLKRVKLGD